MKNLLARISQLKKTITVKTNPIRNKITTYIDKNPFKSFLGLLVLILIIIVAGNFLRKPKAEAENTVKTPKTVVTYSIGKAPRMEFQAKVEKTGAIKLIAQAGGIVQKINLVEGSRVNKGTQLLSLSTNAAGGNISSVSRQIAFKNYEFVKENYPKQVELIQKRRELAEKVDSQSDELRSITDASLNDTRDIISLNEQMLSSVNAQLQELEQNNTDGSNDALILQTQQAKAGILSALSGLKSGLKNAEFQSNGDNEPAQISNLSKDITLKQLEIEEKSLALNKELSKLNLKIAQISESLMYPQSPCSGIVDRIFVRYGQAINPGQQIAAITCDNNSAVAVVSVSGTIARNISRLEPSIAVINNESQELTIRYISQEPTDGSLHSVIFDLPQQLTTETVSDNSFISIQIPIGQPQTTSIIPYIPLDSVYQTETSAYVFTAAKENDQMLAKSKHIKLGTVYGEYVEVKEGIGEGDQIIVSRTVTQDDIVTTQ